MADFVVNTTRSAPTAKRVKERFFDFIVNTSFGAVMELTGRYTIFSEGARGHPGRQLLEYFKLTEGKDPQSYVIGI